LIGTTTVNCSAADSASNTANGSFTVTIQDDSTPPVITAPASVTVETGIGGAIATWTATATDETAPANPVVTCIPASGSFFTYVGSPHTVTCTASDAVNNTSSVNITVNVVDTIPPTVTPPSNMTVEATGPSGAVVSFYGAFTVSDFGSGLASNGFTPPEGSLFPLGVTSVDVWATDNASNTAHASFTITVVDTTAPTLNLPANITVSQVTPAGAVVSYTASATDAVDGAVAISCNPPSGSTFPAGTTTVNCSATDAHSNTANGSFTVTVTPMVNLLANPGYDQFNLAPKAWQYSVLNIPVSSLKDCTIYNLSPDCSLKLSAARTTSIVTQTVSYAGAAGNTFSFGLFSRALNVPVGGTYKVEVSLFNRFNRVMYTQTLTFNAGTHDFEMVQGQFTAPAAFTKIRFRIYFQQSTGVSWFDDAFLYRLP
jgi:hypothetical protein